jgi:hypothetical protein
MRAAVKAVLMALALGLLFWVFRAGLAVVQQRRLAGRPRAVSEYHATAALSCRAFSMSTTPIGAGGKTKSHHDCITPRRFSTAVFRR